MQIQNESKEEAEAENLNLEDFFNTEGLIFPQFVRPGSGHTCDYRIIKTGYSVSFTSFMKYLEHVMTNHDDLISSGKASNSEKLHRKLYFSMVFGSVVRLNIIAFSIFTILLLTSTITSSKK